MMPMQMGQPGMGGPGGPMAPGGMGGGLIPPAPQTMQPGVDPSMLAAMQGPQQMAGQPIDPNVLQAIMQMLGPGGGTAAMLGGPIGPSGNPAMPAPPGQGAAMTPWQQAMMLGGGGGGQGGAAGIRGLPGGPGGGY